MSHRAGSVALRVRERHAPKRGINYCICSGAEPRREGGLGIPGDPSRRPEIRSVHFDRSWWPGLLSPRRVVQVPPSRGSSGADLTRRRGGDLSARPLSPGLLEAGALPAACWPWGLPFRLSSSRGTCIWMPACFRAEVSSLGLS